MTDVGPPRFSAPERREQEVTSWDDPHRPVIVVDGSSRRRDPLDTVLRLLTGLTLAMVVLLLGAMLLALVSIAGTLTTAGTGVGQAGERLLAEAQRAAERVGDLADPTHPPRGLIQYDTEFDQLRTLSVGESVALLPDYTLTLSEVRKRDGARGPSEAQYAVLHRKLKTPNQTKVGPVVIREDWDEADYYLYKGETFRVGRDYYRVNWVSVGQNSFAAGRYRNPDNLTEAPKFQLD